MKKLTWIFFVIALIIVAYETFKPQPPFPAVTGTAQLTSAIVSAFGVH